MQPAMDTTTALLEQRRQLRRQRERVDAQQLLQPRLRRPKGCKLALGAPPPRVKRSVGMSLDTGEHVEPHEM